MPLIDKIKHIDMFADCFNYFHFCSRIFSSSPQIQLKICGAFYITKNFNINENIDDEDGVELNDNRNTEIQLFLYPLAEKIIQN